MRADGSGQKRLTNVARLRRRAVLHARRHADRLAPLRRAGADRRRLDDEARRHRPEADHRLRIDELGAVRASVRASTSSSRRTSSGSRTSSCSWSTRRARRNRCASPTPTASTACRCRRPTARQLAWTSSRAGGVGRPDVSRAVESREGARGAQATRRRESQARNHERSSAIRCSLDRRRRWSRRSLRGHRAARSAPPRRRGRTSRRWRRDALEGRLTGSTGERLAGDYIVVELQRIGAKPLPGQTDFRCRSSSPPAPATAARRSSSRRRRRHAATFDGAATCRRCRSPTTATSPAPVVFAGYGIVVPESQDFGYDSYATLDVKDKIVARAALLPRGRRPEDARASSRATPTCATRRWRRGSAARRRCSSSPGRARRTPARRCR